MFYPLDPSIDRGSIRQGYRENVTQLRLEYFASENEDPRVIVQRHFNQQSSDQWLLIFDNADELDP